MGNEIFANIAITNKCNAACRHCDVGRQKTDFGMAKNYDRDECLAPAQWQEILDRLQVTRVHISGVEPLLYPKLDTLLQLISEKREVWLTTNGLLYEKWKAALRLYCANIAVSIDGIEAHDKIRGVNGIFVKAIGAVVDLKVWKKDVRVSFAICPDNQAEMTAVYDLCERLFVPVVFNHYNYIAGQANDYYDLKEIEVDLLLFDIEHCKTASFLPMLKSTEELRRYYHEKPKQRVTRAGGCAVLAAVLEGKRFSMVANGDYIPSVRCWYEAEMGNALDGLPKLDKLRTFAEDIIKNGFPPACQRLCCAGNLVGV